MNEKILNLAIKDFTTTPWPRYKRLGDDSWEEFFEKFIAPHINEHELSKITVNLDGVIAYTSSFLSESFWLLYKKLSDMGRLDLWDTMEFYSEEFPDKINFIKNEWPKYGIEYK